MRELTIRLKEPHPAQVRILSEAKRFNVLCCGRRFGKTELSQELITETVLTNDRVAYYAPTYKDLSEVWRDIKHVLHEIIVKKDEQLKTIETVNGGFVDFWSLENPDSSRGRKYKRIIIDEFEKASKAQEAWEYTIRATLTDLKGDAWFLSTPKGINTYFKTLSDHKDKHDDWMSWQMPTSANPFMDTNEIAQAKSLLDPIIFKQEFEAEFTSTSDKPFLYAFDSVNHVDKLTEVNPKLTLYLSFDFNVDPMTCIVGQHDNNSIRILDEFRLRDSDVYEICGAIKAKYPRAYYNITGDASGIARHVSTKGNINNYTIILDELNIPESQLFIPRSNPPISESRTLCNALLSNFDLKIHPRCEHLLEDLAFTQVDQFGAIDKRNPMRTHLLDTFRYYCNTWFGDYLNWRN